MTNKEQIVRNIGLSFDLIKQIIKDNKLLSSIKNGSAIEFIDKDFLIKEKNNQKNNSKYFRVRQTFEAVK